MKKYIRCNLLYSPYYEKWKSFLKENVHGDVPEEVLMQTAEYLGSDGIISLHDAFSEACRDCAPRGSELYKDWYNGDLRKYIPSEYVGSSTSINCSEENYELSPELSSIIDDYTGHKFKNPTTGWTGSCEAYLRELSDGAILVSFVFGGNESEPDEFTYNPETGKSVFYPYNGTIVHANSLDELRNAMRREYSYLKRIDK